VYIKSKVATALLPMFSLKLPKSGSETGSDVLRADAMTIAPRHLTIFLNK
jgi:hypothetical protein